MNAAAFPTLYTKEQYKTEEIVFPDGVTFQSLLGLDFYHKGKNVVMYGSTGTGKTMLSILIGISACKKGIPVKFYRTAGLINQLVEHKSKGTLTTFKKSSIQQKLLFWMSLAMFRMTELVANCYSITFLRFMNTSQ